VPGRVDADGVDGAEVAGAAVAEGAVAGEGAEGATDDDAAEAVGDEDQRTAATARRRQRSQLAGELVAVARGAAPAVVEGDEVRLVARGAALAIDDRL